MLNIHYQRKVVTSPIAAGLSRNELSQLFKVKEEGLHFKYCENAEWKNGYPDAVTGNFTVPQNIVDVHVVGIPNDEPLCAVPRPPFSCPSSTITSPESQSQHKPIINNSSWTPKNWTPRNLSGKRGNAAAYNNTFGSLGSRAIPSMKRLKPHNSSRYESDFNFETSIHYSYIYSLYSIIVTSFL